MLKGLGGAIRNNIPAITAVAFIEFIVWIALTIVLSEQLNRLGNTAKSLWLLPSIPFFFFFSWFNWVEVAPNYEKRREVWWLGLFWVPFLGKLPPFRGRPKEQWVWNWRAVSVVVFLMGSIMLVAFILSLFLGSVKYGG